MQLGHLTQTGAAPDPLAALWSARPVAVVGASDRPDSIGRLPVEFLLRYGFRGRVVPVRPDRRPVCGVVSVASVADAGPVDHAPSAPLADTNPSGPSTRGARRDRGAGGPACVRPVRGRGRAAASHTAALAAPDRVVDSALRRLGIVRVDGVDDLLDAGEVMTLPRPVDGSPW